MRCKQRMNLFIYAVLLLLYIVSPFGCNKEIDNLSKGTPSVPQGPAVTLQEEHNLREANKFERFTEHTKVTPNNGIEVTLNEMVIGKTEDYLTNLSLSLTVSNLTKNKVYIYDLIFNNLLVRDINPQRRDLIDKHTDHFLLMPDEQKKLKISLELPWFQRPHPSELKNAKELEVVIVSSHQKINVDEFFIQAKKVKDYEELPQNLKVLNSKKETLTAE